MPVQLLALLSTIILALIAVILRVICLLLLLERGSTQYTYGDHGNGTIVKSSTLSCPGSWSVFENTNSHTRCKCGSNLGGVVHCDESTLETELQLCFCMSFYIKDPNITVVGACIYSCHGAQNVSDLSDHMCGKGDFVSNREGQLCGRCKEGFVPPAYSYDWRCVSCSHDRFLRNFVKYCVVAFVPLTIFLIIIITLHISATSPSINAFLLACQVLTSPMQLRIASSGSNERSWAAIVAVFESLYGFWNLDFFRTLYPRFCLHPGMSTLQVLALDYIIAAYPLLLTIITYSLVQLHNHDCKLVVWLWKPFRICFARLQRQWDIQTSLIEAFASFLLLSYVKFLSVSFDFLVPVHLYNAHGESMEPYLYFDGTVEYFGKQHLPYAILAIAVLSIFNILPLVLLCLYPCHCFQKILNSCKLRCQALHIFMDAFQGCYKNGTDGTRDFRSISAVYLLVRIIFFMVMAVALSSSVYMACFIVGVIFTLFAILFAILQPYKSPVYNTVDTVLFLIVAMIYYCIVGSTLVNANASPHNSPISIVISVLFVPAPLIYMTVVVVYWLFFRHTKMAALVLKVQLLCKSALRRSNSEESLLPERLANPEECAALLQDPMDIDQYNNEPDQDLPSFVE